MKKVLYEYQDGHGEHNLKKVIVEFGDEATSDDIQTDFEEWVWQFIGDSVSWNIIE